MNKAALVAGILAFVGDFVVPLILGGRIPLYRQTRQVVSELGVNTSPVARTLNAWLVVFGILVVMFALGLGDHLGSERAPARLVMGLVIIFAIGAGIVAGIFPLDPGGKEISVSAKIHGIAGGMGFLALLAVPFVSLWIVESSILKCAAGVFMALGVLFFTLFMASGGERFERGFFALAGLWQRLFLAVNYAFLLILALSPAAGY